MRIVAGQLGGRVFDSPRTKRTHPMSERMRGALFNSLGDLNGLSLLDAFGGSGALSFEAISRGVRQSQIVEIDKTAFTRIVKNIEVLGLDDKVKATRANVSGWSDGNPDAVFDLVICNPPFDGLKVQLINKLVNHVRPGGLFVLCWPTKDSLPKFDDLNIIAVKEKGYGDAQLGFYRKL